MLRTPDRILLAAFVSSVLCALSSTASAQDAHRPTIPELGDQICSAMMVVDTSGTRPAKDAFELIILNYLEIDEAEDIARRMAIREFWNANHELLICTSEARGYDSPQHLLKRILNLKDSTNFYFDYFLQDRALNVNSIEYRDGRPETLIDYIDQILQEPEVEETWDVSKLRRLRTFLIDHMNGKHAVELRAGQ